MVFTGTHSALCQTWMVDVKTMGGVHVVQDAGRVINHERIHCHIEGCRLLHRAHPPRFRSYRMDCQTVEGKSVVQEIDLI